MSDDHVISRPTEERFNLTKLGLIPFGFLIAGSVLTLGSFILWAFDVVHFAYAWLWAYMFLFTIASGSLFWTLIHHAVDANWSTAVRRILENVAALFPFLAIAFIPLAITIYNGDLLKWWKVEEGADVVLDAKRWYLNHGFFWLRAVLYFVFFIGCGFFLRKWSIAQDQSGDVELSLKMRRLAYGGLCGFALAITFSAVDWVMALNEHWFSTMWGVYIFAGSAGTSMALLILITQGLKSAGYLKEVVTEEHFHIMGKLLFAFTVFWAYISFSQYMLYYYANIPEETIWFHHRNTGSWYYATLFLVFGRFVLPFLWLLTQPAKKSPLRICVASGWIILMHLYDLYWMIMPEYQIRQAKAAGVKDYIYEGYLNVDFAALLLELIPVLGLVLLAIFFYLRKMPGQCLFPIRDPRLYESVTLKN
ncbi:MAG: hypothetical protein AAFY98_07240 [Verrucomicrobiota bacterium]